MRTLAIRLTALLLLAGAPLVPSSGSTSRPAPSAVEDEDGQPHDCPDHGEPLATWEPVEDEDAIRIPYVCHLHADNTALIILEL